MNYLNTLSHSKCLKNFQYLLCIDSATGPGAVPNLTGFYDHHRLLTPFSYSMRKHRKYLEHKSSRITAPIWLSSKLVLKGARIAFLLVSYFSFWKRKEIRDKIEKSFHSSCVSPPLKFWKSPQSTLSCVELEGENHFCHRLLMALKYYHHSASSRGKWWRWWWLNSVSFLFHDQAFWAVS